MLSFNNWVFSKDLVSIVVKLRDLCVCSPAIWVHRHVIQIKLFLSHYSMCWDAYCKRACQDLYFTAIIRFQHPNHLGPLSPEWKHVSQVKLISTYPSIISLLTYFCHYLSVFVCLYVGDCVWWCMQTQAQEIVPTIGFNIEKFKSSR